jgi:hypothetical protein
MYYVFKIINGKTTCQGSYSHELGAYAKKKRIKAVEPYAQIEVVERN